MLNFQWEDENWDTLIHSIQQNECILMLGPDSCYHGGNERRPFSEILANHLAKDIDGSDRDVINTSNLAQVAECFLRVKRDRHTLEKKVKKFYRDGEFRCDLHRNLAALPFYFTVTTSPDFVYRDILKDEGKNVRIEWYHFRQGNETEELVEMGTVKTPLIYYLFGTIAKTCSLVLTENDLLDFLVALISNNPPLPENILSELKNESKNFLFIGFGFHNWYLRILLHALNGNGKHSTSYAIEQSPPCHEEQYNQTVFFFRRSDYKLHIFNMDVEEFSAQLRERFEKGSRKDSLTVKNNPKTKPLVFICHANEDKDVAQSLSEKLEREGLKPWLSKNCLPVGIPWDEEIERIIKEDIKYFVVLHSEHMAGKRESYFFKEIRWALERWEGFTLDAKFIFPVKFDSTDLIRELENFQSIEWENGKNMSKLVKAIKDDYKKEKEND